MRLVLEREKYGFGGPASVVGSPTRDRDSIRAGQCVKFMGQLQVPSDSDHILSLWFVGLQPISL